MRKNGLRIQELKISKYKKKICILDELTMVLLEHKGKIPEISKNSFVSPMATLIGDVKVNDNAIIWPGSIIRGENASINIGEY